jgi:hypothetical protein
LGCHQDPPLFTNYIWPGTHSILTADPTFCHLSGKFLHGHRTDAAFLSLRFARFSGNLNPWTARWSGAANGFVSPELGKET